MHTTATPNGTRAVTRHGDPAQDIQNKLAQIRHLSYAAIREITAATHHAEQAVTLLADASGWLALLDSNN